MADVFSPSFIQIASFFTVAQVTLLLAAAVFLFALQPRSTPKTLLALFFAVYGTGSMGGVLAWAFSPDDFTPAYLAYYDLLSIGSLVLLSLAWIYPRPARVASLPGAILLVATLWQIAYVVAYFSAREWWMASAYGAVATAWIRSGALALAALSCVLRMGALPQEERKAANLVVFAMCGGTLTLTTMSITYGLASLRAGGGYLSPILLPAGNALPLADHLVSSYLIAPALAFVWWRRERFALVWWMAGYGVVLGLLALTPASALGTVLIVQGLVAVYALARARAFRVQELPRRASRLLAAIAGAAVFMIAVSLVLAALGEGALALASAIVLGLGLGATAAWLALPRGALPLRDAGEESTRRLSAYGIALERELRAGRSPDEAGAALADLRAVLRVSDDEHAALVGTRAPAATGDALLLGRYRPIRVLGEGGGGVTRLCLDERVGREVVLKSLRGDDASPERLAVLLREARAIGAIKHPNVVTLHDVVNAGREAILVMEHAERGSLRDALRNGPLALADWRRVASGLLAALEAVHGAGVIHRDVKPSNVLLAADGTPKLADFGIASVPGFETTVGGLREGAVGTFRYMSPEQAKGRPATVRSDLFSAGATLYEALTGVAYLEPRAGESAVEVQMRAASGRAFDAPIEPPALRAWFERALDPDLPLRFASAADMREALEAALSARA